MGSRGGRTQQSHVWWHGPEWLTTLEIWSTDVVNEPSEASPAEAKLVRKVLNAAVNDEDDIQRVLNRFQLQRPYEFVHVRKGLCILVIVFFNTRVIAFTEVEFSITDKIVYR